MSAKDPIKIPHGAWESTNKNHPRASFSLFTFAARIPRRANRFYLIEKSKSEI